MVGILRKHSQFLMTLVTLMVIIAFIWLYNRTDTRKIGSDRVAVAYGRDVTQTEIDRRVRLFRLASGMGLYELLDGLVGRAQNQNAALEAFVWNGMALEHAAAQLQIAPTDEAVAVLIQGLPAFQTSGQFDPAKYSEFVQKALAPSGFSESQMTDLARMQLQFTRIRELLDTGVGVTPAEVRQAYEREFGKIDLSVVRLTRGDFEKGVTVSPDEVAKRFEDSKAKFNTDERRKVRYAELVLSPEQAKLEGKARVQALQTISDKAGEFAQAMLAPGATFDAVATQLGLVSKVSSEFAAADKPAEFSAAPTAVTAAFRLTDTDPNSDAIQFPNGFLLLHLDGIVPSQPLTLEQASPQIEAAIKAQRVNELIALKAGELRKAIVAGVAGGKSFADAAKEAGVEAVAIPAFSLREPPKELGDLAEFGRQALELEPGQTSEPVATTAGSVLVHLVKREPVDEKKFEEEQGTTAERILAGKQQLVLMEWMRQNREAAGIRSLLPPRS